MRRQLQGLLRPTPRLDVNHLDRAVPDVLDRGDAHLFQDLHPARHVLEAAQRVEDLEEGDAEEEADIPAHLGHHGEELVRVVAGDDLRGAGGQEFIVLGPASTSCMKLLHTQLTQHA